MQPSADPQYNTPGSKQEQFNRTTHELSATIHIHRYEHMAFLTGVAVICRIVSNGCYLTLRTCIDRAASAFRIGGKFEVNEVGILLVAREAAKLQKPTGRSFVRNNRVGAVVVWVVPIIVLATDPRHHLCRSLRTTCSCRERNFASCVRPRTGRWTSFGKYARRGQ